MKIYFDNAATSPVCDAAKRAAEDALEQYANPSSPHEMGIEAGRHIAEARSRVAAVFGCAADRIVFTSGGTEANNTAVLSHARRNRRAGMRIVTDLTEHPSVLAPVKELEAEGFEAVYIPVTGGIPDWDALAAAARNACLVTFMQANNQTGCVFDVEKIRAVLDSCGSRALFHCDAVQAFTKTSAAEAAKLVRCCDTVSVSSHKIGGLKGCGALYVRGGVRVKPLIRGGEQEYGLRGGTENTVGIAAFGAAARDASGNSAYAGHIRALRERFIGGVSAALGDRVSFFIPPSHIDNIVSISIAGLRSEVCLNFLSGRGIYISSSSACSSRAKKNTVLPAYGLPDSYTDCAVRIAFSRFNTAEETDCLVSALAEAAEYGKKD